MPQSITPTLNTASGCSTTITIPSGGGTYLYQNGLTATATGGGNSTWQVTVVPANVGDPLQVNLQVVANYNYSSGGATGSISIKFYPLPSGWADPLTLEVIYFPDADIPPLVKPKATDTRTTEVPVTPQVLYADCGLCSYIRVPDRSDVVYRYCHGMRAMFSGGGYLWDAQVLCTPASSPVYLQVRCLGPAPGGCGHQGLGWASVWFTCPIPTKQPPGIRVFFLRGGCRPPANCHIIHCPR